MHARPNPGNIRPGARLSELPITRTAKQGTPVSVCRWNIPEKPFPFRPRSHSCGINGTQRAACIAKRLHSRDKNFGGGRYHSPSITPAAIRTLYPSCFLSHVATQLAAIVDVHTLRSAHSEPSKSTNQRRKHNPPGAEKLNSEILCTLTLKRNDNRCPRKRPPLKSPQHLTQRYETAAEEPVTTATI